MAVSGFRRVLRWTNFTEVETSPSPPYLSETHSGFNSRYRTATTPSGKVVIRRSTFSVQTTMDTESSWVVKGKKTADLLRHEQGHYDISALAARQLHDEALRLEADTAPELQAAFDRLSADTEREMGAIQHVYDEDINCGTDHGANAHNQAVWVMRIRAAKVDAAGRLSDLATCPP